MCARGIADVWRLGECPEPRGSDRMNHPTRDRDSAERRRRREQGEYAANRRWEGPTDSESGGYVRSEPEQPSSSEAPRWSRRRATFLGEGAK